MCLDEMSNWNPTVILNGVSEPMDLWHKIAQVILNDNQQQLDILMKRAEATYSIVGFRIAYCGFRRWIYDSNSIYEGNLILTDIGF